jgi:hypothetical protein
MRPIRIAAICVISICAAARADDFRAGPGRVGLDRPSGGGYVVPPPDGGPGRPAYPRQPSGGPGYPGGGPVNPGGGGWADGGQWQNGCIGCGYSGGYYGSNVTVVPPAPPPRYMGQWRNGQWYY